MSAQKTQEKKTVLVIDDDLDMSELICAVLKEAGYNAAAALDGKEGLEKAKEIAPDLVLLDIMLPKMDGIEVCRNLANDTNTKSIPVIMVTVKQELSSKLASYIAGARRYITKPFGIEDLLGEVEKTLRQSKMSQSMTQSLIDPRD
jgi:two-component system, OmpR family, alkaline phosphatase synthesis response regulator PhoP